MSLTHWLIRHLLATHTLTVAVKSKKQIVCHNPPPAQINEHCSDLRGSISWLFIGRPRKPEVRSMGPDVSYGGNPLADFPAVFFHISFGICHGTQLTNPNNKSVE